MRYIILSVTGFSSSRREVGVFHHFITFIFFLFLNTMFVKKALRTATLVFYSEPKFSLEIKVVIKLSQDVKRRMSPLWSSFSGKKLD